VFGRGNKMADVILFEKAVCNNHRVCEVSHIRYLWDKHFESMSEDYRLTMSNNLKCLQQMVLKDIDDIISSMDKDIHDYGLPELDNQDAEQGYHNREVRE
jgi:ATP-dependent DNA helicase PIF1